MANAEIAGRVEADPPGAVSAAIIVGSAALFMLGVQPTLLHGLVVERRLSDASLGRLAMVEVLAIGVMSLAGIKILQNRDMRLPAAVLALALCCADVATYAASTAAALFLLRILAGVIEGLLLGGAVVVLTRAHAPERVNGVFLAVQTVPQAIAAFLFPTAVIPIYGVNAAFAIAGLTALTASIAAPRMPRRSAPRAETVAGREAWSLATLFGLLGVVLQGAGIGATWNYSAELASNLGFSDADIAWASSGSLLFQVAGAFVVAGWCWRWPAIRCLGVGTICQAGLAFALARAASGGAYIALFWIFGLFLLGLGPYQIALLIRLDPTRRAAMLTTVLTLLGWSAGPFVASFAVRPGDSRPALYVAIAMFFGSGIAYVSAARRLSAELA